MPRVIRQATDGPRHNGLIIMAVAFPMVFQMFVLPLVLLPAHSSWGWALLPLVLLSNSTWAVIHEAIHGVLFPGRRHNRRLGSLLAIGFGAAFDLLRWGHLLHHAHSRTRRERSEVFSGERPSRAFRIGYYLRLGGGLYFLEVAGSLALLLPRSWLAAAGRRMAGEENVLGELAERVCAPETLRAARLDALLILVAHGTAFWLYGEHAWMYALSLAGRAFLVSLVDNAFHYGTPLDAPRFAKNLRLHPWFSALILHFNLHGAHHLRPGLGWRQLPACHAAQGAVYHEAWWPAVFRQCRGPLGEDALREEHGAETQGDGAAASLH